jgi:hypothetical protein
MGRQKREIFLIRRFFLALLAAFKDRGNLSLPQSPIWAGDATSLVPRYRFIGGMDWSSASNVSMLKGFLHDAQTNHGDPTDK